MTAADWITVAAFFAGMAAKNGVTIARIRRGGSFAFYEPILQSNHIQAMPYERRPSRALALSLLAETAIGIAAGIAAATVTHYSLTGQ